MEKGGKGKVKISFGRNKIFVFLAFLCALAFPSGRVHAEEGTLYQVTFRPGSQGRFENTGDGQISANGSVSYLIPSGASVASYVPDIVLNEGYYIKNTEELYAGVADSMQEYVVKYGMLVDSIGYEVRYVDREGNEIARTYIGYTNQGESITAPAKEIAGYTSDAPWKSIANVSEADHIIEFVYDPIDAPQQGGTSQPQTPADGTGNGVVTDTGNGAVTGMGTGLVVSTAGNTPAVNPSDAEGNQTGETPDTELQDEDVPLANTELQEGDEEVPLANKVLGGSRLPLYLGIGFLIFLISASALYAGYNASNQKKKQKKNHRKR